MLIAFVSRFTQWTRISDKVARNICLMNKFLSGRHSAQRPSGFQISSGKISKVIFSLLATTKENAYHWRLISGGFSKSALSTFIFRIARRLFMRIYIYERPDNLRLTGSLHRDAQLVRSIVITKPSPIARISAANARLPR